MDKRNNTDISKDLEYTIVMDGNYQNVIEQSEALWEAVERREKEDDDNKSTLDRLYYDYEKMCMKDPTVLDKDDIYPHSYQWRLDAYDAGKKEVLEEALRLNIRIADTEAYQKYVSTISKNKFTPDSWE